MKEHFLKLNMNWLTADGAYSLDADVEDEYLTYQLPPDAGVAYANMLKTSHNISIYCARHEYDPNFQGEKFNKGNFSGEYESDTFMIGTAFGSQITQEEYLPECTVKLGGNLTLFRHANRFQFDSIQSTTQPMDLTFVTLPTSSLKLLIGEQHTEYLLSALDISDAPSVASHPVPLRITNILKSAISPHLKGRMKQLYSQAKVLEYLCKLIEYIEQQNGLLHHEQKRVSTIHEINDLLSHLEGKLPSIAELAEWACMSAQTLNQEFCKEFGLTIHRFMSKKRLEEAHSTIQETTIPLKTLATRLGYSHVNHFITAFKREFGYTPGSLRR
ncbi:MAG: AraC family transcriptional regulator [Methylotenera sp.]|nr:AraC family transcriptional regulator [Methylotenera sp.]